MRIAGLQKTTLLDYPGHLAATVFVEGCNFRCPFCHNGQLVLGAAGGSEPLGAQEAFGAGEGVTRLIPVEEVWMYLKKRKGILQGVCITGGEPTLQRDLAEFIGRVKAMGYLVKLDTNGYRPEILRELLDKGLLDYVAMDVKASKKKYAMAAGVPGLDIGRIEESIALLKASELDYEFRTTVVKGIHSGEDFEEIGKWLAGAGTYYLQAFRENENMICNRLWPKGMELGSFSKEEMIQMAEIVKKYIAGVKLRGVE